jgi:hypothetical protein
MKTAELGNASTISRYKSNAGKLVRKSYKFSPARDSSHRQSLYEFHATIQKL